MGTPRKVLITDSNTLRHRSIQLFVSPFSFFKEGNFIALSDINIQIPYLKRTFFFFLSF